MIVNLDPDHEQDKIFQKMRTLRKQTKNSKRAEEPQLKGPLGEAHGQKIGLVFESN